MLRLASALDKTLFLYLCARSSDIIPLTSMNCILFTGSFTGYKAKHFISKVEAEEGLYPFKWQLYMGKKSIFDYHGQTLLLLTCESILLRIKQDMEYLTNHLGVRKRMWC